MKANKFKQWEIDNAIVEGEKMYHINLPSITIGVIVTKESSRVYSYKIDYVRTDKLYTNNRYFSKYRDMVVYYMNLLLSLHLTELNSIQRFKIQSI